MQSVECLSPLMLCLRISIRARCTTLCDKVFQWVVTGQWFNAGSWVLHQKNWPPRYSWNIVDKFLAIYIAVILLTSRLICSSYIMLLLLKLTFSSLFSYLWCSCFQWRLNYLASNYLTLSAPDEGYSRNASCALN